MKLARELSKRQTGRTLYLLDEPTTGLHFDDVRKLLEVLHRLTDLGNTVIIIEHNLDIIRNADYILDMGPEGGEGGGRIIAHGTPEQIATVAASHTGSFLARYYTSHNPPLGSQAFASRNGTSHAGPQPATIAARPDALKQPKGKFIAPEKKTGLAKASATKPDERSPKSIKPKPAKKSTISKASSMAESGKKKAPSAKPAPRTKKA
jgi:excinuclease ABC subunit A